MLTYRDAYLAPFCTPELETLAAADVANYSGASDFSTDWTEKLTVTRCYILACMENQASPEDLFTAKLSTYKAEFKSQLSDARAAAAEENETTTTIFSVNLERA